MSQKDRFSEMLKLKGKTNDTEAQQKFNEWYNSLDNSEKQAFDKYDKKWTRITIAVFGLIFVVLVSSCFGSSDKKKEEPKTQTTQTQQVEQKTEQKQAEPKKEAPKTITPEEKIKDKVKQYVKDYSETDINDITVNPHLGTEKDGDYVVLVRLTWNVKNSGKLSREMLEMYSSDMAARMYNDFPEAQELAVFWTVPYLNGQAKVSFERANGGMVFTDKVFDKNFRK